MTFHLDLPYLNYILDIIRNIEKSINNTSKEKFLKENDLMDANVRRIEIISEAVKNLSDNIKNNYNEFDWKKLETIRDRITNKYFGVDFNLIWEIIKKDIPILKEQILKIKGEEKWLKD